MVSNTDGDLEVICGHTNKDSTQTDGDDPAGDRLYAIRYSFRAYLGRGRFQFIEKYVLYDQATKIIVDISDAVKPEDADNFHLPAFTVMGDEKIEFLEDYLTGRKVPTGNVSVSLDNEESLIAIKYFFATELLGDAYGSIRSSMVELKKAKQEYDTKRENLSALVRILSGGFLPSRAD